MVLIILWQEFPAPTALAEMRYATGHKARTRRRIVEAAAAEVRRRGIAAVSIPELMAEAGLTHGAFYAHFPSKEALLAEALAGGFRQTAELLETAAAGAPPEHRFAAIVDTYLSLAHRNEPATGCVLAALGGEIARREPTEKVALQPYLDRLVGVLAGCVPAAAKISSEDRALAVMAAMVGAMVMARVAPDDASAVRIMRAVRGLVLPQ